jgi:hypothetical protein
MVPSKRSVAGLAAVVAAIGAIGVSSAQAANMDTAHCTFGGTAGVTPAIPLLGPNQGAYTFTAVGGTCSVADPGPTPAEADVSTVNIASQGTFAGSACGTGNAHSTPGQTTITATNSQGNADEFGASGVKIDYDIAFTAGQGVLTVTTGSHADGSGASGNGTVSIQPIGSGPGVCATGFAVEGSAVVSLTDSGVN